MTTVHKFSHMLRHVCVFKTLQNVYVRVKRIFAKSWKSAMCSVSRWRPHKVDKRMVLEYTHGLFIT
jgi:hypothetical protein